MAAIDANIAQLTFESANLAPETFQVVRFEGEEQLSQPFRSCIQTAEHIRLQQVEEQPVRNLALEPSCLAGPPRAEQKEALAENTEKST